MVVGHASLPLSPYTATGLGQFSHSRQPALQPFTLGLLRNGQLIGSITGSAGIVRHSPHLSLSVLLLRTLCVWRCGWRCVWSVAVTGVVVGQAGGATLS